MRIKAELLDNIGIERALKRISHEIIETNKGVENLVLLGVVRGGVPVCEKLAKNIENIENVKISTGKLDITDFRDDIQHAELNSNITSNDIAFSVRDKDVVICDNVLFTGRSVRAAIEAVFKLGRPRSIQLAVLIDRGHRELPIRADYVGKNVPTSRDEIVQVTIDDNGESKAVILCN